MEHTIASKTVFFHSVVGGEIAKVEGKYGRRVVSGIREHSVKFTKSLKKT